MVRPFKRGHRHDNGMKSEQVPSSTVAVSLRQSCTFLNSFNQIIMNTKTHTVTALSAALSALPADFVRAPDLIEIIDRTMPADTGLSVYYKVGSGIDWRIATLASMVTNAMASALRTDQGIDKFNDAMALLDQAEMRKIAFSLTGIDQADMIKDLRDLLSFRAQIAQKIKTLAKKDYLPRWGQTIERAAQPRAVEGWKVDMAWLEFVEKTHGKPEMTEAEYREVKVKELQGQPQNWGDNIAAIISTIDSFGIDEEFEFADFDVKLQKAMLEAISSEDKEAVFLSDALKFGRSPEDVYSKRALVRAFLVEARKALTHRRYQETGEVQGKAAQTAAFSKRLADSVMAEMNDDFVEVV